MRLPTPRKALAALGATAMLGAGSFVATVAIVAVAPSAGAATVSTEQQFRDAWANDADITLANDITLTCDGGRAERTIGGDFVLDGQGHTITQTCPGEGVLKVGNYDSGPSAQVRNVTITGGSERAAGEHGGGLYFDSSGALSVANTAFLDNSTCADGGGLDYEGDALTISHSTLAANVASGVGGALWASGNSVVIIDSTVSGNQAQRDAGALQTAGTDLQLGYVTLVQNTIGEGPSCNEEEVPGSVSSGGHVVNQADGDTTQVNVDDGTLTSFGSVVALPSAGETNCFLTSPATTSQGDNFSDDASCGFTGAGDRENAGDPGLGALGYNGGLAPTQVPQPGSPLLDAIPVAACQTGVASGVTDDERSVTRPQGPGCDIGAVEVEVVAPAPLVVTPRFTG